MSCYIRNEEREELKMKVSLNAIEKVKRFNAIAMQQEYDISLVSGRYVIDGKSIMGIFSLNLSEPVELIPVIKVGEELDLEEVKETFKEFIV